MVKNTTASSPSAATASPGAGHENDRLTVYFDGACPLCAAEIGFYRKKDVDNNISWVDAADSDASLGNGLDRTSALGRFHVRTAEGELFSGGRAFAEMWAATPGFRWLGRIARSRIMSGALEILYRGFLLIRPGIQRLFRAKQGKGRFHDKPAG